MISRVNDDGQNELVIITGSTIGYEEDVDDAELWTVNHGYVTQSNMTRLYFMDTLKEVIKADKDFDDDGFIKEINKLGIPIYCQEQYPEIENSIAYPKDYIVNYFGISYFTSTIAFMLAHAIAIGFGKIILHKVLLHPHAPEYQEQKACLDFWCGVAIGKGIQVVISPGSVLCKPFPWQAQTYGYTKQRPEVLMFLRAGFAPAAE